jgi:hypothetical protein
VGGLIHLFAYGVDNKQLSEKELVDLTTAVIGWASLAGNSANSTSEPWSTHGLEEERTRILGGLEDPM